jgi:hypothetical protein
MVDDFASHSGIAWNGHVGTVQYGGGDRSMVVLFYNRPVNNPAKSRDEGRPIYEDKVYVRIHPPGERLNIVERAANESDKRRFPMQWAQFQQNQEQIPEGTPIDMLYPDQPSVGATLKAYGVHTIEQCAELSGPAIDSIGMGAQRYVNDAQKYLSISNKGVKANQFRAELEERDRKISSLEHTIDMLKSEVGRLTQAQSGEISLTQLQAAIAGMQGRPGMPIAGTTVPLAPQFDAQTALINATHRTSELKRPQSLKKRARIRG